MADLYVHNVSRRIPQKGSSDQTVACLRRLAAGVVGSAAACAFRFRPPRTGSRRAGWRRSGAILFAFFGAVCFEPDASRARLRFKAAMTSMTGGGAAISLGLTTLHLGFEQFSQGLLVTISIRPRIETPGPLRDDRLSDRGHLGVELAFGHAELRRPNLLWARKVKSAIPVPRGSTATIRSRRLSVSRPSPTTPPSAIAAPITRGASTAIGPSG